MSPLDGLLSFSLSLFSRLVSDVLSRRIVEGFSLHLLFRDQGWLRPSACSASNYWIKHKHMHVQSCAHIQQKDHRHWFWSDPIRRIVVLKIKRNTKLQPSVIKCCDLKNTTTSFSAGILNEASPLIYSFIQDREYRRLFSHLENYSCRPTLPADLLLILYWVTLHTHTPEHRGAERETGSEWMSHRTR